MRSRRLATCSVGSVFAVLAVLSSATPAWAADLILNAQTVTLGGVQIYDKVTLTNGSKIIVTPFNGTDRVNTGNLVIKANSITVDATSVITAKGSGYLTPLCLNGAGPSTYPLSGGRGGCGVRDSGGGGAHFGGGGRGTKDAPASYPAGYEEDCIGSLTSGANACASTTDCRNNDGLPTVAGISYQHNIFSVEFGAAGGDKGCRDGDGFAPSAGTTVALAGGSGGGRIVLFAANAGQTGALTINGVVDANGNRGCGNGNDSGGGGAGGTLLLIGDTVTISNTAKIVATGGRGGDEQPKCLACSTADDCGGTGQTCVNGRCSPCNCTPCTGNAQCNTALGQTCKSLGGAFGNVCADANNLCTPVPDYYEETECKNTQTSGTCDDCGGGGGGGIINVLSRAASINPLATFDVRGSAGGVCPICTGEAGGSAGELQIDGAYVGEICDGWDNDFNGSVDDGLPLLSCGLPSCVNGIPQQCPVDTNTCKGAVTDTRPRFVVILDTSGSMLDDPYGRPTFGDGSTGHLGVDTASDADTIDGNNSKLYIAKQALNNVLSAFPHADYALARYHQDVSTNRSCQTASWFECENLCCSYDDPRNNITPASTSCNMSSQYPAAGYPSALNANINLGWSSQNDCINYAGSCGAPRRGADVLAGFGKPLQQPLMWLDGKETNFNTSTISGDHCSFSSGGDCELRATGPTPLAASLDAAADYLKPIIQCDAGVPCRKYSVILLTDGAESCMGDPIASATALRTTVSGVTINTYVIGFSVLSTEQAQLNAIAAAGGTGTAFFASDQSSISNALASIIASSTNFEKCNGLDDNCNNQIDEDFPDKGIACDDGKQGICKGTGVRVCNASQDGTTCQITTPGKTATTEVCNGVDDNCNGLIDEGAVCQICVPTIEICNGIDDDCDGTIDNNPVDANQPCGLSLGQCKPGLTTCAGGVLNCTGSIGATSEVCDGLDNNCDGVIDGMTQPCYGGAAATEGVGICRAGTQACTSTAGSGVPSWGTCIGELQPAKEICDGLDNDCNGIVDDQVSDGLGHMTGDACCRSGSKCGTGVCSSGKYVCAGSQVVCDGGETPSGEMCDGLDNDCNGTVDDVPGKGTTCAMPGGCAGILDCQTGTGLTCVASATPGVEVCNGIDDDCDGSIDEEPDVSTNDSKIGVSCDAPTAPNDQLPCKAGKTVCKAGGVVCEGAVHPTTEVCDGVDNDCNGTVDQPDPCQNGQVCTKGTCLNKCQAGEFPCPGGENCVGGVCIPVATDAGADVATDSSTSDTGAGGSAHDGGDASDGKAGSAGSAGTDAGKTDSGAAASAGNQTEDKNDYGLATGGGGFSCSTSPVSHNSFWATILGLGLATGAVARRKNRKSQSAASDRRGES